jgi:hypothetical protein
MLGINAVPSEVSKSTKRWLALPTEGAIQYEIENFGRHITTIHWDNGLRPNVFPNEIGLIDGDHPWWQ